MVVKALQMPTTFITVPMQWLSLIAPDIRYGQSALDTVLCVSCSNCAAAVSAVCCCTANTGQVPCIAFEPAVTKCAVLFHAFSPSLCCCTHESNIDAAASDPSCDFQGDSELSQGLRDPMQPLPEERPLHLLSISQQQEPARL